MKSQETKEEVNNLMVKGDVSGDRFLFVPDNLFIFKQFEVSTKTSDKKILEEAFNRIVEDSPLPIEQLLWGVVPKNDDSNMCVWFAGLKDRVQAFSGEVEENTHVMPHSALGMLFAKPSEVCMFSHHGFVSVIIDGVPSMFLKSDMDDFASLKAQLPGKYASLPLRRIVLKDVVEKNMLDYKCSLMIQMEEQASTEEVKQTVTSPNVWLADIRSKELLKNLKQQKYWSWISAAGIKWAGVGLLLTLLIQVFLGLGYLGLTLKNRSYKDSLPAVKKIEDKDFLVRQMQTIVEQEVRPFELLGVLNSFRPKSIYFSAAIIDNAHNIIVEAVAETAMSVDEYVNALKESELFEAITVDNINASNLGTKFKLSCDLKEKRPAYFLNLKEVL